MSYPPALDQTKPSAKRRLPLFWQGFIAGFLLLALGSCGAVFALSGVNDLSLADLQNAGPAWTPPPIPTQASSVEIATPEPQAPANEGRFQTGMVAINATNSLVNIRRTPGYLGKPQGDILIQMQPGDSVTILDGPEVADSLTWWFVRYQPEGQTIEGWVAESTASGVQILAPAP